MEWSERGEWDNCNSIINKYIFKKRKKKDGNTYSQYQHKDEAGNVCKMLND